ncbi:MAG: bifunctional phosphoribosylaminoimidazolecarboxamide formyltransferase/IMP cyclohydrolase [Nitrospirota bacterium]
MKKVERALISLSNKEGIVEFTKSLIEMGVEILSTGGTSRLLRDNNIQVKDVSECTGFPEMLDGRVKTLHPIIHGGLLGKRDDKRHVKEMEKHGIQPIDMVIVNLYPFEETIKRSGSTFEDAIENIDIGGPAMLRSAAKNFRDVAVVVDPIDYSKVLEEMKKRNGCISEEIKFELAKKVFLHTARYDSIIANYLEGVKREEEKERFPCTLTLQFEKVQNLRYGENPHQQAAFYREFNITEPSISKAKQLHGKEMSFNNFLDANSALELAKEYNEITAVVVKHNNPCGVAMGETTLDAYRKARETDPVSAFGAVIAFNHIVNLETAREITSTFVEVVIAPGFEEEALKEFKKKKNLRILDIGPVVRGDVSSMDMKKIVGGLILQDRDLGMIEDIKKLQAATKRRPTKEEYKGLEFAWRVCKHVKSNAIIYAKEDRTIGIGAGQMSRVDSVKIAAMKSRSSLKNAVMASDAFFPFRDGIDAAFEAGITAVIQPGGSLKDDEVIKAADEHNMAMVFTGMRHFRH